MKELKELKPEELSLEQKLGMSMIAFVWGEEYSDVDYIEELIRNHSLGGIWIVPRNGENKEVLRRLLDAADYPLLSFTDAENGWGDYKIGRQNAVGMTGSEELAYTFGKVTAIGARNDGYNVICSPVVDIATGRGLCGSNIRSLGGDKKKVAELAAAEARGMHDGGVLSIAKHFPGHGKSNSTKQIDTHMAEGFSISTKEELIETPLYPYFELNKQGVIDGIMLGHAKFVNIDSVYPTSLSSEVVKIFRERGFSGLAITDALNMMGVVAKFGKKMANGLAIGNAGAMALPFHAKTKEVMTWLRECYAEGVITDEVLEGVVSDVLEAQHKVNVMQPKFTEITEEDKANFARINNDSVFAKCDDGVPVALARDEEHFFAILTETELGIKDGDKVQVDTMKTNWYNPLRIAERLKELYPNSKHAFISEYPTPDRISRFLSESLGHGDVVFVTFMNSSAYAGPECLTPRIVSMLDAMQVSDRISTFVHFGNPYVAEDFPHASRVIIGTASSMGVEAGLNVLAGNYPANGVLTYDIKLQ